jgi:crotonobetainyl-CoA:carnitine CoA-transferase CaiB-like acyl-CoA transferase
VANILQGVRVLELGQVLAGPFAGSIFADLGAEVIKLERVEGGDDARHMGPAFRHGDALSFHIFNRGKKSVAVDLKSAAGRAVFNELAAQVDILIHNLRPGVTEAMGLDAASVCAAHPRLIYCEISAFGHQGPMRLQPGYEPLIQAFSGLSSSNGGPDDPPLRSGASVCDQGTGMWVAIGALAMLQQRQRTGRGGVVSASLLETAMQWNAQRADVFANQGVLPPRHRSGHPGFVPYESFDTADEPLLICCGNDRLFAKMAQALQQPQWLADARFATNRDRLNHKADMLAALGAVLRTQLRAHWLALFNAAGVPCAPVHSIPQALAHPQVQALGMQSQVPGQDFVLTALPLSFDGVRPALPSVAPGLGAHNAEFGLPPPVPVPVAPGD